MLYNSFSIVFPVQSEIKVSFLVSLLNAFSRTSSTLPCFIPVIPQTIEADVHYCSTNRQAVSYPSPFKTTKHKYHSTLEILVRTAQHVTKAGMHRVHKAFTPQYKAVEHVINWMTLPGRLRSVMWDLATTEIYSWKMFWDYAPIYCKHGSYKYNTSPFTHRLLSMNDASKYSSFFHCVASWPMILNPFNNLFLKALFLDRKLDSPVHS